MRLLSAFISWLNDQPAGTQGLVFAALAIAASVGGKVLTTGASALWGVTRRKYSSWQESRESGEPLPSKIGLYDRAVNAAAALQRLPEAITTVGEHYHRIVEKHEARRRQNEEDVRRKQELLRRFAKDVRPDVNALAKTARQVSNDGELIISSYRSLLHKA